MPYHTEFIRHGTCVYQVGTGQLSGQEFINAALDLRSAMKHADQITHALVDLTTADGMNLSLEDVRRVVAIHCECSKVLKTFAIAIAAPSNLTFGLSRMYGALLGSTGWRIQVVRTLNEAWAWLNEFQSDAHPR